MKNVHKLQYVDEEYFQHIGIKHDMTQEQRERDFALRREAKALQEVDESGNFRYLVRGQPWDRKIVKVRIQNQREIKENHEAMSRGRQATDESAP